MSYFTFILSLFSLSLFKCCATSFWPLWFLVRSRLWFGLLVPMGIEVFLSGCFLEIFIYLFIFRVYYDSICTIRGLCCLGFSVWKFVLWQLAEFQPFPS
jgi:hypothetical protein